MVTFRAEDFIISKIPSRRRNPIAVGGTAKVERKEGPNASPERWGSELEDGRRQVEAALLVLHEFGFADVRAFGTQKGNTHSASIFVGPNWECFDARHVLSNGKRAEAGGGGA